MRNQIRVFVVAAAAVSVFAFVQCAKKKSAATDGSTDEGTTTSETAGSVVGGTVGATSSGGQSGYYNDPHLRRPGGILDLLSENPAWATTACPTILTTAGSGCTQNSAGVITLAFSGCSYGSSAATWSGNEVINTVGGDTVTCGTFPTITDNNLLGRSVNATRTSAAGTVLNIESAANLTNYTGSSVNSSQGIGAFFVGGKRTKVMIYGIRLYVSGVFDHTIISPNSTALNIDDTTGSKVVTGTLAVYHNLAKVTGTSTFNNVTYTSGCCNPTSGSISTTFTVGTNGDSASKLAGKTETLTYTGCGTASLVAVDGTTTSVTPGHCI